MDIFIKLLISKTSLSQIQLGSDNGKNKLHILT